MHDSWDPIKCERNLRDHGIDFADCWRLFDDYVFARIDERFADEERWFTLGLLFGTEVAAAYVIVEEDGQTLRHWISVRRATKHERTHYWEARRKDE